MSLVGAKVVVVGAGIAGLSAAISAADRGARVTLVDERGQGGGLLARHEFRGVPCDLGSHRLHRAAFDDPRVASFFDRVNVSTSLASRPRRGVLLFRGRRIPYPPSWLDLARGLGRDGARFAIDLLRRGDRLRGWERARMESGDDVGFASFVRARVGEAAYEAFYRPYAEKVWGLDADEVSQTVAKARVSTTSPWSLVGGAALRRLTGRTEQARFLYPKAGLAPLVESILGEAVRAGVEFRFGARFDLATSSAEHVLFSGRMRDLAPDAGLDHRGVHLLYLALPVARLSTHETYYTPESRWWFGRVSELANYAPKLSRPGETILCVEIPEGRWGRDVAFDREPRLGEVLRQLREAEILPDHLDPIDVSARFVPDVYPLYRRGWISRWSAALDRILAEGRVIPFGRQGLYLHCNIDACVALGLDAVDHVEAGRSVASWSPRAHAALGLRVRD